jgi:mRNA-degrading endonuclease toxin of MazEF toxin-antitoxin module
MQRGDIWFVKFGGHGHEYQKWRPAVIIESDRQLKITNVVTVIPCTSQQSKHRDDIFVAKSESNGLKYDSLIKVHHIQTFDLERFDKKLGVLEPEIFEKIKKYLKIHFDL